jgi:hypothetical protein
VLLSLLAEAGKKRSKAVHLLDRSIINMILLLFPIFDSSITMIGPGGLLLVVCHPFAAPEIPGS